MKPAARMHQYQETITTEAQSPGLPIAQGFAVPETPAKDRESLSESFNDEIDQWARRALAANGFGDY